MYPNFSWKSDSDLITRSNDSFSQTGPSSPRALLILCAVVVRVSVGRGIFFSQERVGRDGRITEYPVPRPQAGPASIVADPPGGSGLWFTEHNTSLLAHIGAGGQVTEYSAAGLRPTGGLGIGPDGDIWFGTDTGMVRANTQGHLLNQVTGLNGAAAIVTGSDKALWFSTIGGVGRLPVG